MWTRVNSTKNFKNKNVRFNFKKTEIVRSSSLFLGSSFVFVQRSRMKATQMLNTNGVFSIVNYCIFNGRPRSIVFIKLSRFSLHGYSKKKLLSGIKIRGF
jgi:hypothetical protein